MIRWQNLIGLGALIALTAPAVAAPGVALAASTITYTYDVFGQLTAVSSTAGRSASYTYDLAGNRTNMTATGTTALNAPSKATPALEGQGTTLAQAGQSGQVAPAGRAARAR
jgi:YD repeat-containing protein